MIDLYVISDDVNIDNISKKSADLKLQEETLKKQLAPLEDPDNDDKIVAFNEILAQIKDIDSLDYDKQKFIVKKLIKKIDVWNNNKIKIHWNIKFLGALRLFSYIRYFQLKPGSGAN